MVKVTFFDVEYANSKNKSICQIGLMCEDFESGEPIYPELDIYINPDDGFDENCVKVHGITASKVASEQTFDDVWKTIEKYFTNAVVIGHNVASSDLDALVKNLKRYNIDIPEMYYICTYELSKKFIPSFAVNNFSLSALCDYFEIDIDSEHNAFDDACACSDLLRSLCDEYNIDLDGEVKKYIPHETKEYSAYVYNPALRKSISEFYGLIRGFSIDNIINEDEIEYIVQWKNENLKYANQKEISDIIKVIDEILKDNVITTDEIVLLQETIKSYLDIISTSPVTLATQILDGILKGITADGQITEIECKNLRQWLYDNIYLSDHFPFDKTIEMVDDVLADGVITGEELEFMTNAINDMLNPVESLRQAVNSVAEKHICLSGNFSYGPKSKVESYIVEKGGVIDSTVKKTTDILVIGNDECLSYSNGTYGTKVKKALEYNEKGCNISIVKEADLILN